MTNILLIKKNRNRNKKIYNTLSSIYFNFPTLYDQFNYILLNKYNYDKLEYFTIIKEIFDEIRNEYIEAEEIISNLSPQHNDYIQQSYDKFKIIYKLYSNIYYTYYSDETDYDNEIYFIKNLEYNSGLLL